MNPDNEQLAAAVKAVVIEHCFLDLFNRVADLAYHLAYEQLEGKERDTGDWSMIAASNVVDEFRRAFPDRCSAEELAAKRDYELEQKNKHDKAEII